MFNSDNIIHIKSKFIDHKKIIRYILILIIITIISVVFIVRKNSQIETTTINGMYFDTLISITLPSDTNSKVQSECLNICKKYESMFNPELKDSDIYKLNNAGGIQTEINKDTYELLEYANEYNTITDNAFNPCIYPLVKLWNITGDNPKVPAESDIINTLLLCNGSYTLETINGKYYCTLEEQTKVDIGAIAKGYIGNKISEYLKENNVKHALINLGGNVVTVGGKTDNEAYTIAIEDPNNSNGTALLTIKCKNISIVSSGQYERNFVEDGVTYGHILDTKTGYPVSNGLAQVTIICKDSCKADAYSTACFVMGLDKAKSFIDSQEDVDAIFVDSNGNISYSDNFEYEVNLVSK